MLKWIGGCAIAAVVLVAVFMWLGYRQVTAFSEGGPTSTLVIHAPAARVFPYISNADSMTHWRVEGLGIRASRTGTLAVGDTLVMQAPGAGQGRMTWVVSEVVPDLLVAARMYSDSGQLMLERRDSLEALGDSTRIHISMSTPGIDSIRAARGDTAGRVPEFAAKLMVGGMRMQSEREVGMLRARIQGRDSSNAVPRQ